MMGVCGDALDYSGRSINSSAESFFVVEVFPGKQHQLIGSISPGGARGNDGMLDMKRLLGGKISISIKICKVIDGFHCITCFRPCAARAAARCCVSVRSEA